MKKINAGNYVLFGYLAYYLVVMISFRGDIHWRHDMVTALAMSMIIGFALNTLRDREFIVGFYRADYWRRKWWHTIRICFVPFCVSSFSALGPRIGGYMIIVPLQWMS